MLSRSSGPFRMKLLLFVLVVLVALSVGERLYLESTGPTWYAMANGEYHVGHFGRAANQLETGLASDSPYLPAYPLLAECYLAAGRPQEALAVLTRARSLDANQPELDVVNAQILVVSRDAGLLDAARAAVLRDPTSPRGRAILAYALALPGASQDEAHARAQLAIAAQLSHSRSLTPFLGKQPALSHLSDRLQPVLASVPL